MKKKTVHTSRTIMLSEFSSIMDFALEKNNFLEALEMNVSGKKSGSSLKKTNTYLKTLYGFENQDPLFKALRWFWKECSERERRIATIAYALLRDELLMESCQVLQSVRLQEKVSIELLEETIEKNNPKRFSVNTRKSMAQNIASSWKQAGFIEGKTKNIRIQPEISYRVAAFAFFLAYLEGARGEFILSNPVVKSLCLSESELRELAIEAAKQDLLQYQFGGNVTSFAFPQLLSKLEIQA